MIALLSVLACLLQCSRASQVPTQHNYDALLAMQAQNVMPWPSARGGGNYRVLSDAQLKALGQQFFPNTIAPQNATALALSIYDWTMPDFRRPNFYLTARGNVTVLGALITYLDPSYGPHVPRMFGLSGLDRPTVLQQLTTQITRVNYWCESEYLVLKHALLSLPENPYSNTTGPKALYRGGGRDVPFYCNQFDDIYGLSIDDCISRYFQPKQHIEVRPFWSSTPDKSVISRFEANVVYNILPNKHVRRSWHARQIYPFSVDIYQNEYLYPSGSRFQVVSATCGTSPYNGQPFWNITLLEANPHHNKRAISVLKHMQQSIGAVKQCVS